MADWDMEWILRLNELFELIKSVIFGTIEKTTFRECFECTFPRSEEAKATRQ